MHKIGWVPATHRLLDENQGARVRAMVPWPSEAVPARPGKIPLRRIEGRVAKRSMQYKHLTISVSKVKQMNVEIYLEP